MEYSDKALFNFYLSKQEKEKAIEKLNRVCAIKGEVKPKGFLAAFLRVQIKLFNLTPIDKIDPNLIDAVIAEFELTNGGGMSSL